MSLLISSVFLALLALVFIIYRNVIRKKYIDSDEYLAVWAVLLCNCMAAVAIFFSIIGFLVVILKNNI